MISLLELGVDGIITNRPDILKGVLAAEHQQAFPMCTVVAANAYDKVS